VVWIRHIGGLRETPILLRINEREKGVAPEEKKMTRGAVPGTRGGQVRGEEVLAWGIQGAEGGQRERIRLRMGEDTGKKRKGLSAGGLLGENFRTQFLDQG